MQPHYQRLVVELREERTASQSRILVRGKVVPNKIPENPDMCPFDCKKKGDDLRFIKPKSVLLTRHHADKRIGLFSCDGCPDLLFKSLIVPTHEAPDDAQLHENVKTEHAKDDSITVHSAESLLTVPTPSMMPFSAERLTESAPKEKNVQLIPTSNKETRVLEHEGHSPTATNEDFKLLTETLSKRLHSHGFNLICRRCSKPLEVGNLYHRTAESRRTKKFYHKECWEALLN